MVGRTGDLILALASAVASAGLDVRAEQPLLLVNQQPMEAALTSCAADGSILFGGTEETLRVDRQDLVRWSTPVQGGDCQELILVDGSRLVLAESWAGETPLRVAGDTVFATTRNLGDVSFARSKLRAILLKGPQVAFERTRLVDQLDSFQGKGDQLLLGNHDIRTGRFLAMDSTEGLEGAVVRFAVAQRTEPVSFPAARVAAIVCSAAPLDLVAENSLGVGLRDGSYLHVRSLVTDATTLRMDLVAGITLEGTHHRHIVHLQSFNSRVAYLSDLAVAASSHKPYLDIPWPAQRDRNVLGGPLAAAGRFYRKGLGVHTSTSLTFDLSQRNVQPEAAGSGRRYQRFAAEVAVDDVAGGRGSVVFQVFLVKEDTRQLAFAGRVVRGGDAPTSISVDLGDAERLVLVADYADRGDECDYANWLDARLE